MVRKQVFSREDVIRAGKAVVARDGMGALSARRVADELGASTAPVYSNFANMEELGIAVRRAVTEEIFEFTTRRFTDDPFLNMGVGVLEFARQQPGLYSAVFMQEATKCEAGPELMGRLAERMAGLAGLGALSPGERALLLQQVAIFTHGLAVHIVSGLAEDMSFDDLLVFLADAGRAMTDRALSRPAREPAAEALMERLVNRQQKEDDRDE
ncbi:TetR family transcriptional regulator [bacterium]|nr:TetR family transcriptional regulator [bacterium]